MDCIGDRTLATLLGERRALSSGAVFDVHEDEDGAVTERTYAQLVDEVGRLAAGLARLGVQHGTKVCVHLTNRPEFLTTWFALGALRAVMVPSNVWNTAREAVYVLERADVEWVVTEPAYAPLFADDVLPACPRVRGLIVTGDGASARAIPFAGLLGDAGDPARYGARPDDLLQLLFTSGTTARPKAVMLTHANAVWCGIEQAKQMVLTPADRNLTSLPLFHVNAQGVALGTLTVGATLVVLQRYSASRFMAQVARHRATTVSMVASLLRTIVAQPPAGDERVPSVRFVKYAINVPDAEKEAFERRFGVGLVNGYGLSETYVSVAAAPVYGERRWPSIGLPLIGRELRIIDARGGEAPRGQIGEIAVRGVPGRTVMLGYYKEPDAAAATLRDGWVYTGDLGWMDADGYLYFHGRKKEMIKRGGENVSAAEVELVLASHPAVADVAVVGVPDAIYDEAVKAFVVLRDPAATVGDLTAFCRERLARFKVPTIIELRESLPKTSIGKVEKKRLLEEDAARRPAAEGVGR